MHHISACLARHDGDDRYERAKIKVSLPPTSVAKGGLLPDRSTYARGGVYFVPKRTRRDSEAAGVELEMTTVGAEESTFTRRGLAQ